LQGGVIPGTAVFSVFYFFIMADFFSDDDVFMEDQLFPWLASDCMGDQCEDLEVYDEEEDTDLPEALQ
jgi:hypothetical protein